MGFVIIGALALYLLISIGVVIGSIKHARKTGKSTKRWGWGAALIMYLIPFWDWLPTVAVHQYYCATEAGFWVYKTPEQWKTENPGVMEKLIANEIPVLLTHEDDSINWSNTEQLNQRINVASKRNGPLFLYRWRREGEWIDSKNNEVLARYVDFYTSYQRPQAGWRGWKMWLATSHCPGYRTRATNFMKSIEEFQGARK